MTTSRLRTPLRCAGLAVFLLPILLRAQGLIGVLSLEVKDPAGAGMQASGRVESLQGGAARPFQTEIGRASCRERVCLYV